jgi:hypothetical protein
MRCGRLLLALVCFGACAASSNGRFAIPRTAEIKIIGFGADDKDATAEACKDFRLTSAQVRSYFRKAHQLKPAELHDYYLWSPCWVDGAITIHGKSFPWRIRAGNTIKTTYPDGTDKMLGAEHSDDPAGK